MQGRHGQRPATDWAVPEQLETWSILLRVVADSTVGAADLEYSMAGANNERLRATAGGECSEPGEGSEYSGTGDIHEYSVLSVHAGESVLTVINPPG